MPGKIGAGSGLSPCSRRRAIRLSRISSFTRREPRRFSEKGLTRNSPKVRATLMVGTPEKGKALGGLYAVKSLGFGLWAFGSSELRKNSKNAREGHDFHSCR